MEIYKNIDSLHLELGCALKKFEGGVGLPIHYSDRLAEEINLLLCGCGLFDLKSCWLIGLKGSEAGTFLQGMVTSDVMALEIGDIQSSLICGNKGKIIHHLEILRSNEKEWILMCDPGDGSAVGKILDKFHFREDLEFRLLNQDEMLRIDLIGPHAKKVLKNLGFNNEKYLWKFENEEILTGSLNLGNLTRLVNLVSLNVIENFIKNILKNINVNLIGLHAFDEIRILEGIPRFGIDYKFENFPQEAGLNDHISYNKGCYVGQEPHSRMYHRGHPNWILVKLKIAEMYHVNVGDSLFFNEKKIGEITSITRIPVNNFFIGIAMIRYDVSKKKRMLALSVDSKSIIQQESLPC